MNKKFGSNIDEHMKKKNAKERKFLASETENQNQNSKNLCERP